MALSATALLLPGSGHLVVRARSRRTKSAAHVGRDVVPGPGEPRAVPDAPGVEEALRGREGHRGNHRLERWAAAPPPRATGPRRDRTGRTCRPRRWTRAAVPPIRWCRSRPPFVVVGLELAVGRVSPAHVLHHHRISMRDGLWDEIRSGRVGTAAVRCAHDQHRHPLGRGGTPDRGHQDDAVAHRHRHGGIDDEALGAVGRGAQPTRKASTP